MTTRARSYCAVMGASLALAWGVAACAGGTVGSTDARDAVPAVPDARDLIPPLDLADGDAVAPPDTAAVDAPPGADAPADAPGEVASDDAIDASDTSDASDATVTADATDATADGHDAPAPDVPPPVPCFTDDDCVWLMPPPGGCETVTCLDGACTPGYDPACCVVDRHCADFDPCTADRCDPETRRCTTTPASPEANCCTGEWLLAADFEGGLPPGFAVTTPERARATWHVADQNTSFGAAYLAFRDPARGTYDTDFRERGEVRTPPFTIPGDAAEPLLLFDLLLDTEWRRFTARPWADPTPLLYDRLDLFVTGVTGPVLAWTSYADDVRGTTCTAVGCEWRAIVVDLAPWRGQTVTAEFRFDTGNAIDNAYGGVGIDNLGVTLACGERPECRSAQDCDDLDRCTDDRCLEGRCRHENNYLPGCCYETTFNQWTFDPFSRSGFSLEEPASLVRWHVSDRRRVSGDASLRFGHLGDTTFDDPGRPVAGLAEGPTTMLGYWTYLVLDAAIYVDVEDYDELNPQRDLFQIELVTFPDGAVTVLWDRRAMAPTDYRRWRHLRIPIEGLRGRQVFLRLRFNSGDAEANHGEGIYVDDLKIVGVCG